HDRGAPVQRLALGGGHAFQLGGHIHLTHWRGGGAGHGRGGGRGDAGGRRGAAGGRGGAAQGLAGGGLRLIRVAEAELLLDAIEQAHGAILRGGGSDATTDSRRHSLFARL